MPEPDSISIAAVNRLSICGNVKQFESLHERNIGTLWNTCNFGMLEVVQGINLRKIRIGKLEIEKEGKQLQKMLPNKPRTSKWCCAVRPQGNVESPVEFLSDGNLGMPTVVFNMFNA